MPALLLSALPYIIGAAMVMGAVYSAKEYVSNRWETTAGIAKGEANIQPKLDQCTGELTKANEAAKAVAAEGARRVAQATQGAAKAKAEAKGAISEAERLRALAGAATPAGSCPAASAVAEIRRGLVAK